MATSSSMSSASTGNMAKSGSVRKPRRFQPLGRERQGTEELPELKGIIFDVDGTLCLPQNYMFREMRSALSIPKSTDILDHIHTLSTTPDGEADPHAGYSSTTDASPQSRAQSVIRAIESRAMTSQQPQPGLVELMTYLTDRRVRKALCTRNFPAPVTHLLDTFLGGMEFAPIITRETEGIRPKPSPEGLWAIARSWGLDADVSAAQLTQLIGREAGMSDAGEPDVLELAKMRLGGGLIMVGDSIDDMAAGYRAGAATVLLVNEDNRELAEHEFVDLAVDRLDELVDVLEQGFVGRG